MKINFVLDLPETEQEEKEELKEIKEKIEVALKEEQLALKQIQKQYNLRELSQNLLTTSNVGSLVKCFMK